MSLVHALVQGFLTKLRLQLQCTTNILLYLIKKAETETTG